MLGCFADEVKEEAAGQLSRREGAGWPTRKGALSRRSSGASKTLVVSNSDNPGTSANPINLLYDHPGPRYETLLPPISALFLLNLLLPVPVPLSSTSAFQTVCTDPYSDSTPGSINAACAPIRTAEEPTSQKNCSVRGGQRERARESGGWESVQWRWELHARRTREGQLVVVQRGVAA